MRTLVVGVGNPIRGDDGVGPVVADAVARRGGNRFDSLSFCGSGLDLLNELSNIACDHLVLVDSLASGHLDEGAVARLDVDALLAAPVETPAHVSSHAVGLLDALKLARGLGVTLPPRVSVYAVGIRPVDGFREGLRPSLDARLGAVVAEIVADLAAVGGAA